MKNENGLNMISNGVLASARGSLGKAKRFFRKYVLNDEFSGEVARWLNDNGDETLRLAYPSLNSDSVVFDVGGYKGDFAEAIYRKYGCTVYVFEPHPLFFSICAERFKDIDEIITLNFGLADVDGDFKLSDGGDGSSFLKGACESARCISCELRSFVRAVEELKIGRIDLMKLNIEGGEFGLLRHIIDKDATLLVDNYQIQFHNFFEDAERSRDEITEGLAKTHKRTWCYRFVWENWESAS